MSSSSLATECSKPALSAAARTISKSTSFPCLRQQWAIINLAFGPVLSRACTVSKSVDHVMARFIHQEDGVSEGCGEALQKMGYFDNGGTRILNCRKRNISIDGDKILSDHRPVTAQFAWPSRSSARRNGQTDNIPYPPSLDTNTTLHFLQSYWNS